MRHSLPVWLAIALFVSACDYPPNKEMDQAQGAIDAARAAGAERFATAEYQAATTALQQANDAVTQRDYRLALNHALDSRVQAQNAAREAANARVRLRGDIEKALADLTILLAQANARLKTTQGRMSRTTARELQQSLTGANNTLQKAGAAVKNEDYFAVQPVLQQLKDRIVGILAEIDKAGSQPARRRG